MLKPGILVLAMLYCTLCHAQCDSTYDSSANQINLKLSYNSTVIYPGMSIGIEYPLKNMNGQILRNHKPVRCVRKGKYISGNLNWYHHPDFHDNLYLTCLLYTSDAADEEDSVDLG